MNNLKERIKWLEHLIDVAVSKTNVLLKERNSLLEELENSVNETKVYKKLYEQEVKKNKELNIVIKETKTDNNMLRLTLKEITKTYNALSYKDITLQKECKESKYPGISRTIQKVDKLIKDIEKIDYKV